MTSTKESIPIQLEPFLLSRKNFYQFLHTLFLEPNNEEILFELSQVGDFEELKECHEGGRILAAFFEQMKMKKNICSEREEYRRLFIGPGTLIAPPWESYYRSKEHLIFDSWTLQVRGIYHQFGQQNIHENNEPDDSLLLELEFMVFLINLNMQAVENKQIKEFVLYQISFLKEHLTIWIPAFCKRVIDHTNSRLYLGAAMLLEDFLNFDLITLLEVREALKIV